MHDDAKLLEAWRAGDRAAGQALFERYIAVVRRFFGARGVRDVDELVQQTFEGCLQGRDRVRDRENFRSYLFGVAYNVMRSDRRQRRRHQHSTEIPAGVASTRPGPTTWVGAREQAQWLQQGLAQLPEPVRSVLELHYFEGLSAAEIARVVVCPEGTVRSRLRRGRRLLRTVLEAAAPEPSAARDSPAAGRTRSEFEPP